MADWYSSTSATATTAGEYWVSDGADSCTSATYNSIVPTITYYTNERYYTVADYERYSHPEKYETKAEKHIRLVREREQRRRSEELRKEQEIAVKQAEELLKEHIGAKVFGKLHKVGYIELDSQKYKGRKYRISSNHMSMIDVLDGDKVVDRLCIHPSIQCPPADHILSRVVLLESAEEYVLATANHSRY